MSPLSKARSTMERVEIFSRICLVGVNVRGSNQMTVTKSMGEGVKKEARWSGSTAVPRLEPLVSPQRRWDCQSSGEEACEERGEVLRSAAAERRRGLKAGLEGSKKEWSSESLPDEWLSLSPESQGVDVTTPTTDSSSK